MQYIKRDFSLFYFPTKAFAYTTVCIVQQLACSGVRADCLGMLYDRTTCSSSHWDVDFCCPSGTTGIPSPEIGASKYEKICWLQFSWTENQQMYIVTR